MFDKIVNTVVISLMVVFSPISPADERVWGFHAEPYTFLFGNHIDTHQELKYLDDRPGELKGWLYVFDSGETTDEGIPVLKHCTNEQHYAAGCVAGWKLVTRPCVKEYNDCQAMYLYHYHDHPVWLICPARDASGNLRGERQCIVQPGSYTHFHWLTEGASGGGTDFPSDLNPAYPATQPADLPDGHIDSPLEQALGVAIDVPEACNVAMASQHQPGSRCPGFFLALKAVEAFDHEVWAFRHGGQELIVRPGVDNKTHLNLLTSYAPEAIPQEIIDELPEFPGGRGADEGGHIGDDDQDGS